MSYIEKKTTKRQTSIITLSDHNKQEIRNIQLQREIMEEDFNDKEHGKQVTKSIVFTNNGKLATKSIVFTNNAKLATKSIVFTNNGKLATKSIVFTNNAKLATKSIVFNNNGKLAICFIKIYIMCMNKIILHISNHCRQHQHLEPLNYIGSLL